MMKLLLKAANSVISFVIIVAMVMAGSYAVYALWDNSQIYMAADHVQEDMLKLKPDPEEEKSASFEELLAINPDVCAWITLDQTNIDYPVLQGENNLTYINRDVYGEFALAGSIYLDSRNNRLFTDKYSLLYGHHMENSQMFGDLDLYKDKTFFEKNTTGTLLLPDRAFNLEIFACLVVVASEDQIFKTTRWQTDIDELISYVEQHALHVNGQIIKTFSEDDTTQLLAMSTCSSEFSDARTVILAVMRPYQATNEEDE